MQPRDIVVIGGSAGSLSPLKEILGSLPAEFAGAILVVVHVSEQSPGLTCEYISQWCRLKADHAYDGKPIEPGHVYVARPGYHLTVEPGVVRIRRGPRENRHRPAIDPLFRTAARVYGPRVIGVILSGQDDDGSAGLYAIRQRGGIAIVQDPRDAAFQDMPRRALDYASPHYVLRTQNIGPNLTRLVAAAESKAAMQKNNRREKTESKKTSVPRGSSKKARWPSSATGTTKPDENLKSAYFDEGEGIPSVFACPECHGVLWELKNQNLVRFRCRVGHSYSSESLAQELLGKSEAALWSAMRALEEKAAMQRRIADRIGGDTDRAKRLLDQSAADDANARLVRDMIFRADIGPETGAEKSVSKNAA